jgi:hypothetical protein
MKKSFLAVALVLGSATTFAQEKQYLPESGDWAVGIDATPFLNYLGNFIGGNGTNTAPNWNFLTTNQTITGKYFASEDMAYRGSLRIGFGSNTERGMVGQTGAAAPTYPALGAMVEDTYKSSFSNIGLAGGFEKRKGSGRLIGFYGAELGIAFGSSKEAYTYGNDIVAADGTIPATTDFMAMGGENLGLDTYGNDARITESKGGSMFGIGIRGFIGAEYFVLPKLSLGGEFGWGLGVMSAGASSTTMESTDGSTVGTQTMEGSKSSAFGLDTDFNNSVFGPAGSLRMTFHF